MTDEDKDIINNDINLHINKSFKKHSHNYILVLWVQKKPFRIFVLLLMEISKTKLFLITKLTQLIFTISAVSNLASVLMVHLLKKVKFVEELKLIF